MLFASLLRLFCPSTRKLAVAAPDSGATSIAECRVESGVEFGGACVAASARTEPLCAPAQIVPLVTRSMHELTAQRPTITVWIGDTAYQAMVV